MAGMFRRLAQWASVQTGSAWYFMAWALGCLGWTIGGALHGFSAGYILVLTVVLSIGTQLQAVLVQNTQIRAERAMQLKLDELVVAQAAADNAVVQAEHMTDAQVELLWQRIQARMGQAGQG